MYANGVSTIPAFLPARFYVTNSRIDAFSGDCPTAPSRSPEHVHFVIGPPICIRSVAGDARFGGANGPRKPLPPGSPDFDADEDGVNAAVSSLSQSSRASKTALLSTERVNTQIAKVRIGQSNDLALKLPEEPVSYSAVCTIYWFCAASVFFVLW